jgi:putative transposase
MNAKPETPPPAVSTLSEAARAQALERFRLLQPCLEEGVPLTRVAQHQGLPLRTMQRWLAQYRRHGLRGLVRRRRADQGHPRRVRSELTQLIGGLALRTPPPTAAFVHRQVVAFAAQQGWPIPSYQSVYAVITRLDPAVRTMAHAGTHAYRHTFELVHRREASGPNAMWQADHTLLDCWLLDDTGKPARPWLTVIMDDYSRAIAGIGLSFQAPSARQTALVLRQAIWRKAAPHWHLCGIPETFYTDHGSDFTSHHLEQVSADLKMRLVFSQPGMPRGRGRIERFFLTLTQLWLCGVPGYAPAGTSPPAPTVTRAALEANLLAFVLDDYHYRPHSETGVPPQARWEAGGFLPRLPESLEQLDLLLLTVAKARQVQRDGIHFQGFRYSEPTLAAYVGEPVIVRYDPRDMAEVRVYHGDAFLCRAICPELAGQHVDLKDILRARNHRRRQVRETIDARVALVDTLLHGPRPQEGEPLPASPAPPHPPRLKRYYHE